LRAAVNCISVSGHRELVDAVCEVTLK